MERILQPELLDGLSPSHPDAIHNRRDLRLTNRVMRNHAWFVRRLPRLVRPEEAILELGAGDGELARRLIDRGLTVDGLDMWPQPEPWPESAAWHQADLGRFGEWSRYAVFIGNLILHQFSSEALAEIGRAMRHARLIMACEPVRRRASQVAYRCIAPLLGANHVTLHDAHVSIAAGFRGRELPAALGLSGDDWEIDCTTTLLGAYRMLAVRRDA